MKSKKKAWMLTITGRRKYWGNPEYENDPHSHYSYDNFVQNHKSLSVGDVVIIRENDFLTGVSIVNSVVEKEGTKSLSKCPKCGIGEIRLRKTIRPEWRCDNGHEFETPALAKREVVLYIANFGSFYKKLSGDISWKEIQPAFENTSTHSIRAVSLNGLLNLDLDTLTPLTEIVSRLINPASNQEDGDSFGDRVNDAQNAMERLQKFLDGCRSFEDNSVASNNKLQVPLRQEEFDSLQRSVQNTSALLLEKDFSVTEIKKSGFILERARDFFIEFAKSAGKTAGALSAVAVIAELSGFLDVAINALNALF